jgi:Pyruvate/2-oxoacid:ferredoxin oxidoreductase delta subunit
VLESDGVISLPKLKTHAFEKFTGCIKNQFGCIPGLLKAEFHVKLPDADDFARMLVDLDRLVHPRLYIMDGIHAMEGNGPRGGTPKKMNVLLFSEDPVALDATACRLINVDPALVPTTRFGQEFGHGTFELNKIELLGDPFSSFMTDDFAIDRSPIKPFKTKGILKFLNAAVVPKPVINKKKCVKCGMCVKICPAHPKAVNWENGNTTKPPAHNYSLCIRCYCCQEVCPEKAISIKKPLLRSILIRKH